MVTQNNPDRVCETLVGVLGVSLNKQIFAENRYCGHT